MRRLKKPLEFCAGVDEAGRGPLAGPVCAAAVILNFRKIPKGLNDSKVLTAQRRDELFEDIVATALAISVAFACNEEIDAVNIRQATLNAMCRAVAGLHVKPVSALIDGRDVPPRMCVEAQAVIDGDALHACIAAASIIAKVTRDRKMIALCAHYPVYGFSSHKGYSTREHLKALDTHGPCCLHRRSFSPVRQPDFAYALVEA